MKSKIFNLLINSKLINFFFNRMIGLNSFKKTNGNNRITIDRSILKKATIKITGNNNQYLSKRNTRIYNTKVYINGNDNCIIIKDNVFIDRMEIRLWGNGNTLVIGDNTTFNLNCKIKAYEGTNITIGEDCMFSYNVDIRTSDGHPIYQNDSRINPAQDIIIGNHVWVGADVHILKGAQIPSGSVVGTKTLFNKKIEEDNSLLGGIPVKIIRNDVNWKREFER